MINFQRNTDRIQKKKKKLTLKLKNPQKFAT